MKININNTKTMMVSNKEDGVTVTITIKGQKIEQVNKFKYLGSMITADARCITDVKGRIGMEKDALSKRKELLCQSFSKALEKEWSIHWFRLWLRDMDTVEGRN